VTPAPVADLTARRRGEDAIARVAAAPVRYVPVELVAALQCRDVAELGVRPSAVDDVRRGA
jgi:hypothetical protein